jgi:hypothetical protein
MKPVPVMVTVVPPASSPEGGLVDGEVLMLVTVGVEAYVKISLLVAAEVPLDVTTVTCTAPLPAGSVTVIVPALSEMIEANVLGPGDPK